MKLAQIFKHQRQMHRSEEKIDPPSQMIANKQPEVEIFFIFFFVLSTFSTKANCSLETNNFFCAIAVISFNLRFTLIGLTQY